jgi:hypothetical protein
MLAVVSYEALLRSAHHDLAGVKAHAIMHVDSSGSGFSMAGKSHPRLCRKRECLGFDFHEGLPSAPTRA